MYSCQGSSPGFYRSRSRNRHRHRNHRADFERPLVLVSSIPHNGQTDVSPDIKEIKLIFGKDFDNDRGWINACNEIDMWQGSNQIPIRIRRGRNNRCDEQRVILVIPLSPLQGGKTYKVRIKSILVDKHGDRDTKSRLIVFSTRCRS